MVLQVDVVKETRTCHLDLTEAQVDGNGFRDVEETSVGPECEGKAVQ